MFNPVVANNLDNVLPNQKKGYVGLPVIKPKLKEWSEAIENAPMLLVTDPSIGEAEGKSMQNDIKQMRERLQQTAQTANIAIKSISIPNDPLYHVTHAKDIFKNLYREEENIVNETFNNLYNKFQTDNNFKYTFIKESNSHDEQEALQKLALRRQQELEKIYVNQKKVEGEIVLWMGQFALVNRRVWYTNQFNYPIQGEQGATQSTSNALDLATNTSFIPGKKRFNIFEAWITGKHHGCIYRIDANGVHWFNPKDPAAVKQFVLACRAKWHPNMVVDISLGDKIQYQTYEMTPDRCPLRWQALEFTAMLKYGLEEIPSGKWTEQSITDYYTKNGDIPEEFKKVDLEIPTISTVNIAHFTPTPSELKEFERWHGIRKSLLECRIKDNEANCAFRLDSTFTIMKGNNVYLSYDKSRPNEIQYKTKISTIENGKTIDKSVSGIVLKNQMHDEKLFEEIKTSIENKSVGNLSANAKNAFLEVTSTHSTNGIKHTRPPTSHTLGQEMQNQLDEWNHVTSNKNTF